MMKLEHGFVHYVFFLLVFVSNESFSQIRSVAKQSKIEPSWIAFGNADGHFQPCGCDPKTDLGGMLRVGGAVQRVKLNEPNTAVFYVGSISAVEKGFDRDAEMITKAVGLLEPSAVTIAAADLQYISKMDEKFRDKLVITNLNGDLPVAKERQSLDWKVLGFVSSGTKTKDTLEAINSNFLKSYAKKFRTEETYTLCLASVTVKDLAALEKSKLCDRIIAAPYNPAQMKLGKLRADVLSGKDLKSAIVIPHAAQGILRGGKALDANLAPISELLSKGSCSSNSKAAEGCESQTSFKLTEPVMWLESSFAEDSPIKMMNDEYEREKVQAFQNSAAERLKSVDSSFVGADVCKSCHAAEYETWSKSKHAQAFSTLQLKNKHQDMECVACHVVGFAGKSGFATLESTPTMTNVQCENCHGPRAEHIRNPIVSKKGSAKNMCVTCHRDQHSPEFKFGTYWDRIKH